LGIAQGRGAKARGLKNRGFSGAEFQCRIAPMINGHARVSTDGRSVAARVRARRAAGGRQALRETASGAKTDRAPLRKADDRLEADAYASRQIMACFRRDTEAGQRHGGIRS
jgi:hypothetical protein